MRNFQRESVAATVLGVLGLAHNNREPALERSANAEGRRVRSLNTQCEPVVRRGITEPEA